MSGQPIDASGDVHPYRFSHQSCFNYINGQCFPWRTKMRVLAQFWTECPQKVNSGAPCVAQFLSGLKRPGNFGPVFSSRLPVLVIPIGCLFFFLVSVLSDWFALLILRLHYVPGGHGGHVSDKREQNGITVRQRRGTG